MARTSVLVLMVTKSGSTSTSTSGSSTSTCCAGVMRTSVGTSAVVGDLSTSTGGGRNRRSKARFMGTILDYKSVNIVPDRKDINLRPSRFLDHVEKCRVRK